MTVSNKSFGSIIFTWRPFHYYIAISATLIQNIYRYKTMWHLSSGNTDLPYICSVQFSSVQSLSHVRLFATSWPAACQGSLSIVNSQSLLKSCSLSRWCHPTISSSVVPFFSCLQSFPASGSFQMSQFFASGGQSIGVSHKLQLS